MDSATVSNEHWKKEKRESRPANTRWPDKIDIPAQRAMREANVLSFIMKVCTAFQVSDEGLEATGGGKFGREAI